mmetsp:Transcript_1267/g.1312  ORF Transcript_1267/g.1312 Transcript_1267/m.1312 type:complete len:205 (+) Transcript_1267:74-688(+)
MILAKNKSEAKLKLPKLAMNEPSPTKSTILEAYPSSYMSKKKEQLPSLVGEDSLVNKGVSKSVKRHANIGRLHNKEVSRPPKEEEEVSVKKVHVKEERRAHSVIKKEEPEDLTKEKSPPSIVQKEQNSKEKKKVSIIQEQSQENYASQYNEDRDKMEDLPPPLPSKTPQKIQSLKSKKVLLEASGEPESNTSEKSNEKNVAKTR